MTFDTQLPRLMARAFNRPLLLDPAYAAVFFSAFGARIGATSLQKADGTIVENLPAFAESYENRRARVNEESGKYEPYALNRAGIASIGVDGTLVHKLGALDPYSGMQGYDGIVAKLHAAEKDTRVRGVILDVDSPGGEVSGVFDAARAVREFSKPIVAVADDQMTSAAYLLASQADSIYASSTAHVGSIGAVMVHYDDSKLLENAGRRVTLIYSGAHKVDGHSYGALPPELIAKFQGEMDGLRRDFAKAVNTGRPSLSVEDALATEAQIYRGSAARKAGLVDFVMMPSAVSAHFERAIKRNNGVKQTRAKPDNSIVKGEAMEKYTQEEMDAAVKEANLAGVVAGKASAQASAEMAVETATAEALIEGATAERERIKMIVMSEAAAERQEFALEIATTTNLDAKAAVDLLAKAPKQQGSMAALRALESGANLGQAPAGTGADGDADNAGATMARLEEAAARKGIKLVDKAA